SADTDDPTPPPAAIPTVEQAPQLTAHDLILALGLSISPQPIPQPPPTNITELLAFYARPPAIPEFKSDRLATYLQEKGIVHKLSLPYVHPQQGVAERTNRTLMTKVRALLQQSDVDTKYWPYTMHHAVHLHNLLSTTANTDNLSPHLKFTGTKGDISMLRVWGCMVQYRPSAANTGKFECRARWGVHLGISFEHHAWNILDHDTSRIFAARDVIFYEHLTFHKFQCDRHADRTREEHNIADYERSPRSFATPKDEAKAALADQDPTDPPPGPRPWSDEDDDKDSAPLDSSRDSLLSPTPSSGHNSDDDVVEVTSDQRHSPELSGPHILGLHTDVSRPPKAVEPKTPRHALSGPYATEWRATMDAEVAALEARKTWVLADRAALKGRRVLPGKWVFRVKTAADGTIERFKARWVVRGFDQRHDVDFDQTFAPVSRQTSVRILLAAAAAKHLPLRQIDVKNAFLYAPVDTLIFIAQPHTYGDSDDRVCQLKKSLYGIKQAPRLWQQHLHQILLDIGFIQLPHDPGMYCLHFCGDYILLTAYMDDLLYTGTSNDLLAQFEKNLSNCVEITRSDQVTQFLGLSISYAADAIHLSAAKYADTLSAKFSIKPANLSTTYRSPHIPTNPNTTPLNPSGHQLYQQQLGCLLFAAGPPHSAAPLVASPCPACRVALLGVASPCCCLSRRPAGCHVALLAVTSPCCCLSRHPALPACRIAGCRAALPCLRVALLRAALLLPALLHAALLAGALLPARRPAGSCTAARAAVLLLALLCAALLADALLPARRLSARAPPCWQPHRPALPTRRPTGRCPALPCPGHAPLFPSRAPPLPALRASLVLARHPACFDTWLDNLQLYLLSDSRDIISLFDHMSGASLTLPATADSATRSQWLTHDAAARLAIRNHLPLDKRAHFGQHKTAKALYNAVVARYSSPATAALGCLILPYLFPELSAFATVEDLITHLRTSNTRYRAALPAEILDRNPPPIYITLYFIVTRLPDSLRAKHLLVAETSIVTVGAARGTPRTPFFEGCSPSPLAPSSATASRCLFRESTTLTPLPAPVPVRLAGPSGGPVLARSTTVLSCPAVSASGPVVAPCSCRLQSHQTLLWHHRLGPPSLPRLRGMHSRLLVFGLPRSLPPLPPSLALPCLPCIKGRQRAAPHSSSFPPTTAPLQTLHMDVKGEVSDVLIPWIRAVRLQLREWFREDLPVPRLYSDRGGEFSSNLLRDFCHGEGILQSFTLLASPQKNGAVERRIGLFMEVARTSMIHAAAPHFLWPFAGPAPSGVSQVDPLPLAVPVEVAIDSGAARGATSGGAASWGAASGGAASRGAEPASAEPGGAEPASAEPEGAESEGAESGGAEPEGAEPGGTEPEGAEPGGAESEGA
ncbi:unnamed protein product, partial [Closterium sp. NIES-54]